MVRVAGVLLAVAVALGACQSSAPPEPDTPVAPVVGAFEPAQPTARLATGRPSQYANLFSPDSFAVWSGPEVAAAKKAASEEAGEMIEPGLEQAVASINDNYYVIECRLESAFSDMSIAYDVVGMRGIDAYLITAAGYKVAPIQKLIGTSADETPVGALRKFGRTNILVFAKRDVLTNAASLPGDAPVARLMLEGFNSQYYFEWERAGAGEVVVPAPSRTDRALMTAKTKFNGFYSQLRTLVHVFD